MAYEPLGLGQLIVNALRTAVTDPRLVERVDAASAGLAELQTRVGDLAAEMEADDAVDSEQSDTLAGIQADLAELAEALKPAMEEVEEPAPVEEPGPVEEAPAEPEA